MKVEGRAVEEADAELKVLVDEVLLRSELDEAEDTVVEEAEAEFKVLVDIVLPRSELDEVEDGAVEEAETELKVLVDMVLLRSELDEVVLVLNVDCTDDVKELLAVVAEILATDVELVLLGTAITVWGALLVELDDDAARLVDNEEELAVRLVLETGSALVESATEVERVLLERVVEDDPTTLDDDELTATNLAPMMLALETAAVSVFFM